MDTIARNLLGQYLKNIGAEIIPVDEVSVRDLVQMYFNSNAPFSSVNNKKSEFPDAIALVSMELWAKNIINAFWR